MKRRAKQIYRANGSHRRKTCRWARERGSKARDRVNRRSNRVGCWRDSVYRNKPLDGQDNVVSRIAAMGRNDAKLGIRPRNGDEGPFEEPRKRDAKWTGQEGEQGRRKRRGLFFFSFKLFRWREGRNRIEWTGKRVGSNKQVRKDPAPMILQSKAVV
jgi:hypothetical protein